MGEKKMLQKERKSPSLQKKEKKAIAPVIPEPLHYSSIFDACSCPSLFHNVGYEISYSRSHLIHMRTSGMGGITKSWISPSPSSSCRDRNHKTGPQQLVQINCSTNHWELAVGEILISSGDDEFAEFKNAIRFQGKIYAISLQGRLAVIEASFRQTREITAFGRRRVVPHCKEASSFREYLVEFDGDLFLVFLLSRGSIKKVNGVEVYRLDTSILTWEKVDRLKGDAMFFLQQNSCFGISASLLGCNSKGSNCVYFTHDRADGYWFVYDMETSCISPIPESLF